MGQGHARRLWSALLALAVLLCVPATAQASERADAKRALAGARKAVALEVQREVRRATSKVAPWVAPPAVAPLSVAAAPAEPPVAIEPPYIESGLHMGGTARCSRGYWDEPPEAPYAITYKWYRDGVAIPGATTPELAIERSDIGTEIGCAAIAEAQTEASSDVEEVQPPQLQNRPRVIGLPYPGRELMCPRGEWNDSPGARYDVTTTWLRDGEPLLGYTDVYTVTADDIGDSFSCVLTAEGEWPEETRSAYASWQPVELRFTPLDDAIAPGATNGYTVSFRNTSPVEASLDYLVVILPDGFRYRPQTTTGALTAEPSGTTENLEWDGAGLRIPAAGELSFSFGVTSGAAPVGHHYVRSYASGGDSPVGFTDAWETARITIEAPFSLATCTVTGTAGDDVLAGTPGADVICGGGGDDVLRGGDGDDVLFGGDGSDRLDAGEGDDTLLGGDGEDILITGTGADVMRGGGGLDSVSYANRRVPVWVSLGDGDGDGEDGEGDDVDADVEIVRGGRSDDVLVGTTGPEEFYAGAGDDQIRSEGGGDLIEAGDGDDMVETGFYDFVDRAFCGSGYDTYLAGDEDRVSACEFAESRPEFAIAPPRG